jgi:hypothetical protein
MLTLLPKGVQTKYYKFSDCRFFTFATNVNDTCGAPSAFEKFETVLMGFSGAWGKLIHEKN